MKRIIGLHSRLTDRARVWNPCVTALSPHRYNAVVRIGLALSAADCAVGVRCARPYSTTMTADPAPWPCVRVKREELVPGGASALVTVSNPAKLNTVNSTLLDQMIDTFAKLSADESLRAVVLTGDLPLPGKAPSFIGGADIREMAQFKSSNDARRFITKIHQVNKSIRELPVPVIARIHGFALGAGFEMMLACDLRMATKGSTFAMPEVKVGIPSVVEAALLPGLVGMGRTRRILYLAESFDAVTAEQWGLVEKVVEDESELDREVGAWLKTIASMGPRAIRSQKKLMQRWENCTVDEGVQAGVQAYSEAYEDGGREPKEYMGRFLNRKR